MDKLLELLKTMEISEEAIASITDLVKESVTMKECELKETLEAELKSQFEQDYNEFTEEIVDKLSLFLDTLVKEELELPAEIKEWAKKGQEYSDILEALKVKINMDEGKLEEATQTKISTVEADNAELKERLDATMAENLQLSEQVKKAEVADHIAKKCADEALTEDEIEMVAKLLEGITDTEEVDEKFETVVKYVREAKGKKEKVMKDKNSELAAKNDTNAEPVKEDVNGKGEAIVETDDNDGPKISEEMKNFKSLVFGK